MYYKLFHRAIIGAIAGYFLLTALPPPIIYLTIAGFILYLCWGPKLPKLALGPVGTIFVGMITTFLAIFVGASGPLVGGFIKQMAHNRYQTVATFSAAMTLQHLTKLIVFQQTGFSLTPWIPLLCAMIISGLIGTWIGLRVLKRLSDSHFQRLFNWILTLLALRLIWQSWMLLTL
ncbi:sulfite exporter TauE/SafE family protein [Vibrio sp. PP-XX7]